MKLRDIFLPKYLHPNPLIRRRAIDKLESLLILKLIIKKDPNHNVRKKAAMKYYKIVHRKSVRK